MSIATLAPMTSSLGDLSQREHEVLALMATGRSNRGIARDLLVSEGAVEKHVANIFMKLGLPPAPGTHRRVLAVVTYLRSRP
jgi:DNA-binding NarL/FixJ family response regulator